VVRLLPAPRAIRLGAIPYALERSRIRVAFVDPSDVGAVDEVSILTGHVCVPGVATELRLLQAQRRFYGRTLPIEWRPSRATAAHSVPLAKPSGPPPSSAAPPDLDPITIPDLPVPPRPSPDRVSAASSAPPMPPAPQELAAAATAAPDSMEASSESKPPSLWLAPGAAAPPDERALGLWSHGSAPPPLSNEEIGDLALASVPPEFARAILFASDRGLLVGWRARGIEGERLESLRISEAEPSVLAGVRQSGTPHFGRVDESLWPQSLARVFDGPAPCAVFPVHSNRGITAVLYADRRGAPMRFEDTALLARAAAKIAELFDRDPPREIRT